VIDLKHEIERELSLIDPPDLWDRIEAEAASSDGDAAIMDLATARYRRRSSMWLAVAAVTVLLALVGAFALLDDDQTVDTTPATIPTVPGPPTDGDGPTILAMGEDVQIGGFGGDLTGKTLNVDAVAQDGEVSGEFRVDDVVVTLECATRAFQWRDDRRPGWSRPRLRPVHQRTTRRGRSSRPDHQGR
jgi:hypothetical protein